MPRSRPFIDPMVWTWRVLEWLDGCQAAEPHITRLPSNRSATARLRYDMDSYISQALNGSTAHANAVVWYYYRSVVDGLSLDPRVLRFLEIAWTRHAKGRNPKIERSLFLIRPRRGNPGGVSSKRRMTPEGKIEAAQMVSRLRANGISEKVAAMEIAELFGVSLRTIRHCVSVLNPDWYQEVTDGSVDTMNE